MGTIPQGVKKSAKILVISLGGYSYNTMNEIDWNDDAPATSSPLQRRRRLRSTNQTPNTKVIEPILPKVDDINDVLKVIHQLPAKTPREFDISRFSSESASFSSRVAVILSQPVSERSLDDATFLLIFAQRCELFSHLDSGEINVLMKKAELVQYEKGDRVYTAGDPCDPHSPQHYTFVIVEGTVSVCAQNNTTTEHIVISEYLRQSKNYIEAIPFSTLLHGEYTISNMGTCCCFGRHAATDPVRAVSVLCSSPCQFMRMPAAAFSEAIEHHHKAIETEVIRAIETAHCLQELTRAQIIRLASHAKLKTYQRNQLVFRQGAPCTGVAIIMSGGFRILSNRKQQLVEVARVAKGEVWGYKSLLRYRKKKPKRHKRRSKHHWRKLSSAVACSYNTSLISHERETASELIWISAADWSHVVLKNSHVKSSLTFSVMVDAKKSGIEIDQVHQELKQTKDITDDANSHVEAHALNYVKKALAHNKKATQWWRHATAHEKIQQHIAMIRRKQRKELKLPELPAWSKDKK